jgi:exodeoxyribonuclease VII small subunit
MTYEELIEALEELTEQMASGAIGIEEATDLYERATLLHRAAADRLAAIEARIAHLTPDSST